MNCGTVQPDKIKQIKNGSLLVREPYIHGIFDL